MSAEASIIGDASPQTRKYVEMKREAETFLLEECGQLSSTILRPGLVYHDHERPWSVPLGIASNLTSSFTRGRTPSGTNLRTLADVTINEALSDLKGERTTKIIGSEEMRAKLF